MSIIPQTSVAVAALDVRKTYGSGASETVAVAGITAASEKGSSLILSGAITIMCLGFTAVLPVAIAVKRR